MIKFHGANGAKGVQKQDDWLASLKFRTETESCRQNAASEWSDAPLGRAYKRAENGTCFGLSNSAMVRSYTKERNHAYDGPQSPTLVSALASSGPRCFGKKPRARAGSLNDTPASGVSFNENCPHH